MKRVSTAFLLAAVTISLATEEPVTGTEALAVFREIDRIAVKVLNAKESTKFAGEPTDSPASRSLIVQNMYSLFYHHRESFKFIPRLRRVEKKLIAPGIEPITLAQLAEMMQFGFIAPGSSLASKKQDQFSIEEFGEAVGIFLSRLADLTHTPDRKWSPYLQRG